MPFPWHQAMSPARVRARAVLRQMGPGECSARAGVRGPQVGTLCGTSVERERGLFSQGRKKKSTPNRDGSGALAIAALLSPAPALTPAAEKVPAVVGPLWGAWGGGHGSVSIPPPARSSCWDFVGWFCLNRQRADPSRKAHRHLTEAGPALPLKFDTDE